MYDVVILSREEWLTTATIPLVEHRIFDEGHPPFLQQILPVSDNDESSRPFQGKTVPRWGPSRVPYSGITPGALCPVQQILSAQDISYHRATRSSQGSNVPEWGPSRIPSNGITPVAAFPAQSSWEISIAPETLSEDTVRRSSRWTSDRKKRACDDIVAD